MVQEDKVSTSAHFVTLTYDNDHVPLSSNGWCTLVKRDFQLFMKRLRKLVNVKFSHEYHPLRYFACGEYGTDNKRPHFHAIIFNCPDDTLFFDAWHIDGVALGNVFLGQVTGDSIAYTVAYATKVSGAPLFDGWKPFVGRDDRVPEFSLMSKGLGLNYVTPNIIKYHNADLSRNFCVKDGGDKIAMPRYYRKRIFDDDARAAQGSIAEAAFGKSNSERFIEYQRLYSNRPDFSFDDYLDSLRAGEAHHFFHNLNSRSL